MSTVKIFKLTSPMTKGNWLRTVLGSDTRPEKLKEMLGKLPPSWKIGEVILRCDFRDIDTDLVFINGQYQRHLEFVNGVVRKVDPADADL